MLRGSARHASERDTPSSNSFSPSLSIPCNSTATAPGNATPEEKKHHACPSHIREAKKTRQSKCVKKETNTKQETTQML
jgi:hypothetical protein